MDCELFAPCTLILIRLRRLKQDKTFFILEDEVEEQMSSAELWTMLLQHIETNLGKVLMATYLGSKRYNLNIQVRTRINITILGKIIIHIRAVIKTCLSSFCRR